MMEKPSWDSPLRVKNLEYKTRREIPDAEFNEDEWYNCTSIQDPPDVHVWVKTNIRKKP